MRADNDLHQCADRAFFAGPARKKASKVTRNDLPDPSLGCRKKFLGNGFSRPGNPLVDPIVGRLGRERANGFRFARDNPYGREELPGMLFECRSAVGG